MVTSSSYSSRRATVPLVAPRTPAGQRNDFTCASHPTRLLALMRLLIVLTLTLAASLCPATALEPRSVGLVDFLPPREFTNVVDTPEAYPFCTERAEKVLFTLDADETTVTLRVSHQDAQVSATLSYSGSCVVWQYYSEKADQFLVDLIEGGPTPEPGPVAKRGRDFDQLRAAGAHNPLSHGLQQPDCYGVVFCGDQIETGTISTFYRTLRTQVMLSDSMTEQQIEKKGKRITALREELADRLTFASDKYAFRISLSDFFKFSVPAIYHLRLGYSLYPDTVWPRCNEPLNNRVVLWSNPIPIEVVE